MDQPLLRLTGVSKRFPGVLALDGASLAIDRGEIHALVGENGSGKSTLIKIIAGVESPDPGGRIELAGRPIRHWTSSQAIRRGIEVIYQDLSLFPNLTVAENIAGGQLSEERAFWVNWRRVRRIADQALARIGADVDLDAPVGGLALAEQQLVAIARALTRNVGLLIMDEPTTCLSRREIAGLFQVVKGLQARGIASLFVSHKLEEVLEIAQRVTVLRDGQSVGVYDCERLTPQQLLSCMSGPQPAAARYACEREGRRPWLEVKGLSKAGQYRDVSLQVFPGEIVGLAGLRGSGRSELALSLFGLNPADAGELRVDGRRQKIRSTADALRLGIGLLPEDRAVEGLATAHTVGSNAVLTILDRLANRWGLLSRRRLRAAMLETTRAVAIRDSAIDAPAETLSGGNQQRLVLAKWLATRPRLLILMGPTVGIDVAAKSAIHRLIRGLAKEGLSFLMISDEVRELLASCNRILLMAGGAVRDEWDAGTASEADIQQRLLET